jgi:ferric-dicitrate binding protein FerR (iron transport regulator)
MMDELLIKYLLGETTPDESARVGQWISANAANRERYEQFRAAWEISERHPLPAVPDAQQALQRLKQKLHAGKTTPVNNNHNGQTVATTRRPLRRWRAAAVFAAVVCAGIVTYLLLNRPAVKSPIVTVHKVPTPGIDLAAKPETPPALQTIVAANSPRVDTLPDGSMVTLHKGSSIAYAARLKGSARAIRLQGGAFFSVVHDAAKPFIVQANDVTVTVIGTSFDIRSIAGSTEIRVKTGAVKVARGTETHLLHAGERIVIQDTSIVQRKHKRVPEKNIPDSTRIHPVKKKITGFSMTRLEAQKKLARGIIDDLIKNNIVADKDHLSWFALDNRQLVVDGRKMPDSLHRAFVARHLQADSLGYYYGPGHVRGSGIVFDKTDLY